jgi:hypothetical protein
VDSNRNKWGVWEFVNLRAEGCESVSYRFLAYAHKLLLLPMSHSKVVKFWSKNTKKGVLNPSALLRCNDLSNRLKTGLVPVVDGPVKAVGELACNLIEVVQVKYPDFERIMDAH